MSKKCVNSRHSDELFSDYNREGYLVIDDVLTPKEVSKLREICESDEFKDWFNKKGADEKTSVFNQLIPFSNEFLRLAKHPKIIDIVSALIGDNLQLHHSKLMRKPAGEGVTQSVINWHRDYAYFPHSNTDLLAVMVMLDDATHENGCMRVVPGSHKEGLLEQSSVTLESFHASSKNHCHSEALQGAVDVTPKAGGISVHHCLTVHGSSRNISGRPRRGLVFQYRADDCYQLAGPVLEETGLLVSGKSAGIVRCDIGEIYIADEHRAMCDDWNSAWSQQGTLAKSQSQRP